MRLKGMVIILAAVLIVLAATGYGVSRMQHQPSDPMTSTQSSISQQAATTSPGPVPPADGAATSELDLMLQQASEQNRFTIATFAEPDDSTGAQMISDAKGIVDGPLASRAVFVSVDASNPANQAVMSRFNVSSSVLPITLVIAANGAVTAGYPTTIPEPVKADCFADALVAPGMAAVLKTLQSGKLAAVCFQNSSTRDNKDSRAAAEGLRSTAQFAGAVEIILVDPADPDEATLIKTCGADAALGEAQLVVIAPPGSVVGKFDGAVTAETVVSSVLSSLSSGCGGGACGPGGCS